MIVKTKEQTVSRQNIVILGAGYGGIRVAQRLSRYLAHTDNYEIVLINKDAYHTLVTQLYQPAVGTRQREDVLVPLRELFPKGKVRLLEGMVYQVDREKRLVYLEDGEQVSFDYLVIALGSVPEYFGIPGLQEHSLTLNSLQGASLIKARVENILKGQSFTGQPMNFVVGGGGLTGVEFTGELASYLQQVGHRYRLTKDRYKIILLEAADQLLPGMSQGVANYAKRTLEKLGVQVLLKDLLKQVTAEEIQLASGKKFPYTLLVWAGGIRGNSVMAASGLKTDPRGRLLVNPYLQYIEDSRIYAVGDSALYKDPQTGATVIPTAQAAIQQAKQAAYNIYADIVGRAPKPYRPGVIFLCISVGDGQGLGEARKFSVKGIPAALLKKIIPLKYYFTIGGLPLVRSMGLRK